MSESFGRYEKVFELKVPVARVWQSFTTAEGITTWLTGDIAECDVRPGGRIAWKPDAYGQLVWDIVEVEHERKLAYREGPAVLPVTTDVTVTLEETGSGTRVTITQAGFGEGEDWQMHLEEVGLSWPQTLAAMELYLRTGIRFDRFFTFRSDFGMVIDEQVAGPCVVTVTPESYAAHAGLRPGDIILQLGKAPIFTRADMWLFSREHEAGEDVEVTFVRGSELCRASAALSAPFGAE